MQTQSEKMCLFCRGSGPFTTVEHIVPASLGNDSDVLEGVVCDKCQNYLSREVERPALHKTPLAFWRTYLGTRTRRGKIPTVEVAPPSGGRIPAQHSVTDLVGYTAHENGSTSVDINDPSLVKQILTGEKQDFKLVLSPWHLSIMGRFIGKIGLEYLALTDLPTALRPEFNESRRFVRQGSTNKIWPIFWGQEGKIGNLKGPLINQGEYFEQEIECYRFSLGITDKSEYIFALSIGLDIMVICLSHRNPDPKFTQIIQGANLVCVHYADNSW